MVDLAFSLYGFYHFFRSAHARPPASSASYHLFAICIDVGLVPLFVITALLVSPNLALQEGAKERWRTFFSTPSGTDLVFKICKLGSLALGGLHLASLVLDLILFAIYRKIAQLPPDMNPLEDNLTSRTKNKHKYKNSSASEITEKRFSEAPSSRMSEYSKRGSTAHDSLLQNQSNNASSMSFFQSRTAADNNFSPHTPNTAHLSRTALADDMYQQSHSARASRATLQKSRDNLTPSNTPGRRKSPMPSSPMINKRSPVASPIPAIDAAQADAFYKRSSKEEIHNDNWFVVGQGQDDDQYHSYRNAAGPMDAGNNSHMHVQSAYDNLTFNEHDSSDIGHQPLRMNPPTPPPKPIMARNPTVNSPVNMRTRQPSPPPMSSPIPYHPVSPLLRTDATRTETMTSAVSALSESSHYSEDDETVLSNNQPSTALNMAPKSRFYGDLAAAMRGVRQQENESPRPKSMVGSLHNTASELSSASDDRKSGAPLRRSTRKSPGLKRPKSYIDSTSGTVVRKQRVRDEPVEEYNPYGWSTPHDNSPRVVSRSGADIKGTNLTPTYGRRDVSGKIAEEGRGGWQSGGGLFMRKVSGAA